MPGFELHQKVADGDFAGAEALLKTGKYDVNAVHERKGTPLHVAAEKGFDEFIPLLMDHGAKPSLEIRIRGYSPMGLANMLGHRSFCDALKPYMPAPPSKTNLRHHPK